MREEMYIKMFGFVKNIGILGLFNLIRECSMPVLQHAKFCKQQRKKKQNLIESLSCPSLKQILQNI